MDGELVREGGRWVLRYERLLRHPPERVWRALTEAEDLAHWFPAAIEGERQAGAPLRFVFPGAQAEGGGGQMRVYDPPRVLEFAWQTDVLRFELSPQGAHCRLVFRYTFDDRSVAARNGAGWHLCLERLAARIDGTPAPDMATWPAGYVRYLQALGLGDFPGFLGKLSGEASSSGAVAGLSEHTPGLECMAFTAPGGARLVLCRATRDAETAEHAYPGDSYLLVAEGAYRLRFHAGELTLTPGMEFHLPNSLRHSGHITAGTRLVVGLAAPAGKS